MTIISAGGAVTGAGGAAAPFDPREYFNTVLWTGNNANPRSITGVGFQPDWVWIKDRSSGFQHSLQDVLRGTGAGGKLYSSLTEAEGGANSVFGNISAFNSDGFTVATGTGGNQHVNQSGVTYVGWNWKANGAGSSNTDGSISSTVSASTDSGFSIVTYTGNGVNGATVGHGLNSPLDMFIIKNRDRVENWPVYVRAAGNGGLFLDGTNSFSGSSSFTNNTDPSGGVFTLGTNAALNVNGEDCVAYCFTEVTDFSKIDSYTGNGSATGPSVTTDFEPTWLMIKRTDSTGDWIIHDSARDATNPRTAFLEPNTSDAEGSGLDVDFNATGFQIKSSSATVNASGGTYIYMCIA